MMFIYKITNKINGKSYIGLDTGKPEEQRRWKAHKYSRNTSKMVIDKALAKHGVENFEYTVIDHADSIEILLEKERYWVVQYNTLSHGYNQIPGGRCSHMSIKSSDERRLIISEINRIRWENTTELERQEHAKKVALAISNEERQNRRERALAMWRDPERADKQKEGMRRRYKQDNRGDIALQNLAKINPKNRFCKTYEITWPNGDIQVISNLRKFCREQVLSYGCMLMMANGRLDQYRDWKCKKL